jgi:hypothetical protein
MKTTTPTSAAATAFVVLTASILMAASYVDALTLQRPLQHRITIPQPRSSIVRPSIFMRPLAMMPSDDDDDEGHRVSKRQRLRLGFQRDM